MADEDNEPDDELDDEDEDTGDSDVTGGMSPAPSAPSRGKNFWENDPIVQDAAPNKNFWENDPVVGEEDAPYWGGPGTIAKELGKGVLKTLSLAPAFKAAAEVGGALGLTNDPKNTALYKTGERFESEIDQTIPTTPEEDQTVFGQAASTIGGIAPIAPLSGLAAMVLGGGIMAAQGAEEQGAAARAAGVSTTGPVLAGAAVGAAAGVGMGLIAKVIAPIARSAPGIGPWARAVMLNAVREGAEFASLGEAQAYLNDKIAQEFYDPDKGYSPDIKRILGSLAAGGALGAYGGARAPLRAAPDPQNPGAAATAPGQPTRPDPSGPKGPLTDDQKAVQPIGNAGTTNSVGTAAVATPPAKNAPPNIGSGGERSDRVYGKRKQQTAAREANPELFTLGEEGEEASADTNEAILRVIKDGDLPEDVGAALAASQPPKAASTPPDAAPTPQPAAPAAPPAPSGPAAQPTPAPAPAAAQPHPNSMAGKFAASDARVVTALRTGRAPLDALMASPDVAQAIANPKINRSGQVPYGAGASMGDDPTVHIDSRIPEIATLPSGKSFPTSEPLVIHETVEKHAMEQMIAENTRRTGQPPNAQEMKKIYEAAHHEYAEPAEDAYYRSKGIDPAEANKFWAQMDKITEKADNTQIPPNLYTKPYPHGEVKGSRTTESTSAEAEKPTGSIAQDVAKIDQAAATTNPNPTEAQKKSGAYKKGVADYQGIRVAIENPRGSTRSGVGADGKPWSSKMPAHYGEIEGTRGADGDKVDAFIGHDPKSDHVTIIDQKKPNGTFDEHKVMFGYPDRETALKAYRSSFSDGKDRVLSTVETSVGDVKAWLASGKTKGPVHPISKIAHDAANAPVTSAKTAEKPNFLEAARAKAKPSTGEHTIIPPASSRVNAAIDRLKAYLPDTHNKIVLGRNIEIMERGGPAAEKMAEHTMKTFQEHPSEKARGIEKAGQTIDLAPADYAEKAPAISAKPAEKASAYERVRQKSAENINEWKSLSAEEKTRRIHQDEKAEEELIRKGESQNLRDTSDEAYLEDYHEEKSRGTKSTPRMGSQDIELSPSEYKETKPPRQKGAYKPLPGETPEQAEARISAAKAEKVVRYKAAAGEGGAGNVAARERPDLAINDAGGNRVATAKSVPAARTASRALRVAKDMFDTHQPIEVDPSKESDRQKLLTRIQEIKADADSNAWNDYNPRPENQGALPEQMWMREVAAFAGKKRLTQEQAAQFMANELQLRGNREDVATVRETRRVENDQLKKAPTTEQAEQSQEQKFSTWKPGTEPAEEAPPTKSVDEMTPAEIAAKQRAYRGERAPEPVREAQKLRDRAPAGETLTERMARQKAEAAGKKKLEGKFESEAGVAKPIESAEMEAPKDEAKPLSGVTEAERAQAKKDEFTKNADDPGEIEAKQREANEAKGFVGQVGDFFKSEAGGVPGAGKPDPNALYRKLLYSLKGLKAIMWRGNDSINERMDRFFGGPDKSPLRRAQELIYNMRSRQKEIALEHQDVRKRLNDMERKHGPEIVDRLGRLITGETIAKRYADEPNTSAGQGRRVTGQHEEWNNARYDELKAEHDDLMKGRPDLAQLRNDIHDVILDGSQKAQIARVQAMMDYREINDPHLAKRIVEGAVTSNDLIKHGMETLKALHRSAKTDVDDGAPYIPTMRGAEKWAIFGRHKVDSPPTFTKRFTDDNGKLLNKYEFDNKDDADKFGNAQKNKPVRDSYYVDQNGDSFHVEDGKQYPFTKEDAMDDPNITKRWMVNVNDNHFELHDTKHEAMARMIEMQKSDEFANINREPARYKPQDQGGGGKGDFAKELNYDADKALRNNELYQRMQPHQQQVMRQAWAETKLEALNSGSSFNSRMRRQGVTGFSSDLGEGLREWSDRNSSQRARLEAIPGIDKAREEADDMIKAESERPRDPAKPRANEAMRGALNELEKRWDRSLKNTRNYKGASMAPIVRDILTTSNMKRLLTPGFYIRNATQITTHTRAILSSEFARLTGIGKSSVDALITKADRDINPIAVLKDSGAQLARMVKAPWTGDVQSHILSNMLNRIQEPPRRRALKQMIDNGSISEHAAMQMVPEDVKQVKFDIGNGPSKLRDAIDGLGTGARKAVKYISDVTEPLANAPEVLNRAISGLAAYDGAIERGLTHEQAVRFATDVVRKSQVNYSDDNKPVHITEGLGGFMRIPWQFKEFGRRQYETFVDNIERVANPQGSGDRKAGLIAIGGLVLTHQLFAGFLHLPWEPVRVAMIMANAFGVTDKDWSDIQESIQEATTNGLGVLTGSPAAARRLSEALMHGLPNLGGWDWSGGLGLENMMVQGEPQNTGHARDHMGALWQWVAQTAFGGAGGMLGDMVEGLYKGVHDHDYAAAIEKALPLRLPVDVAKAIGGYESGKVSNRGVQQQAPYTLPQAIGKAAGFNISDDARHSREQHAISVAKNRQSENVTRLIDAYASASPANRGQAFNDAIKGGVKPEALNRAIRDSVMQQKVNNFPVTKSTRDIVQKVTGAHPN